MNCSQCSILSNNDKQYFNPYVKTNVKLPDEVTSNQFVRDSSLKLHSDITKLMRFPLSVDENTKLKRGVYKIVYFIPELVPEKHLTDFAKAISVDDEFKDVYFYKIDIKHDENSQGSVITAIFEIPVNPILITFIIYAIGISAVGVISYFTMKSATRLVDATGHLLPWIIGILITCQFVFGK